ncbi:MULTISPECIES: hypothetical protein [Acinetobacter]|uniref:Uncharacterized protein n=1 Tax=Acinetobacter wuhouensis TaxID=1879050 RepID=A0A4Q7AIK8_9GAMM|nr:MULTISPECIES: hypothetical protein [Acinetobacter]RZG48090.1 hypothetical protein EXU28_04810 [Acinetobacter wuhouensis]RZG77614.1 hypothetical protein EXE10_18925 [Acinetobacter sp. WCHAc060033]
MTTNQHFQKAPEHKQIQWTQSWYEPALKSLDSMLDVRRANLRKIKRDEKNAMVLQQEFMETLMNEHRLTIWQAGEVIGSLLRSEKISKYGRFIQMNEEVGEA